MPSPFIHGIALARLGFPIPDRIVPSDFFAALPSDVEDHLHQLEDEDPMFADALRMMLWDTYAQAGQPLGPDEAGMCAWWAFGQGTTVQ